MTKLEKIINDRGIKQVWLAQKLNRNVADVNRWVKGVRTPNPKIQKEIASLLDVPEEDIFLNTMYD